jgi:DNA-binding GntR family transcriptional regulator
MSGAQIALQKQIGYTMSPKDKDNTSDKSADFGVMRKYAKKTLNEIIYEDLKDKVVRGEILLSQRLQEDNLAKDYETSRTPIRDALRKLEQENIVEKLPYGGYRIREVDVEEIEEIFGIRGVLESYAASLATQKITEIELQEIEDILIKSQKAIDLEDYDAFIALDSEFHNRLYKASRSDHLLRILQNLWDYFIRFRKISFYAKLTMELSLKDHRMIIQSIKEGNRKAVESIVKEHVNRALSNQKKGLKKKKGNENGKQS